MLFSLILWCFCFYFWSGWLFNTLHSKKLWISFVSCWLSELHLSQTELTNALTISWRWGILREGQLLLEEGLYICFDLAAVFQMLTAVYLYQMQQTLLSLIPLCFCVCRYGIWCKIQVSILKFEGFPFPASLCACQWLLQALQTLQAEFGFLKAEVFFQPSPWWCLREADHRGLFKLSTGCEEAIYLWRSWPLGLGFRSSFASRTLTVSIPMSPDFFLWFHYIYTYKINRACINISVMRSVALWLVGQIQNL